MFWDLPTKPAGKTARTALRWERVYDRIDNRPSFFVNLAKRYI